MSGRVRHTIRPLGAVVLLVLAACSGSAGAPPVLDGYDLPVASTPFRLGLDVDGTVDVGGPNDTSALSQVVDTSGLKVSARMRLDYDQDVAESGSGRTVTMRATAISGRFTSFVASRDLGDADLKAVGHDGTVTLEVARDGTLQGSDGSPLGGFELPVVADVLTGWACPPLPEGGAAPGSTWPVTVETPGGARLTGTATYSPGDVAGRHVLETSAEIAGDVEAGGVDLEAVVAAATGADLPDLHLSPMNLTAHVQTRSRCRLDAEDLSLVSSVMDSTVEVTVHATSDARYDAILDGTTMSFDISASAAPV